MLNVYQLQFLKFIWYYQVNKSECGMRYRTDEQFQPFSISLNEWNARTNLAICALGDKIFEPKNLGSKPMQVRWDAAKNSHDSKHEF